VTLQRLIASVLYSASQQMGSWHFSRAIDRSIDYACAVLNSAETQLFMIIYPEEFE
jgi:hypothetical protein